MAEGGSSFLGAIAGLEDWDFDLECGNGECFGNNLRYLF